MLVSCDASCLCAAVRGFVAIQLQRDHSVLRKRSPRTCCRRAANFGHRCGTFKPVLRQCSLKPLAKNHALPLHFDAGSRPRPVTCAPPRPARGHSRRRCQWPTPRASIAGCRLHRKNLRGPRRPAQQRRAGGTSVRVRPRPARPDGHPVLRRGALAERQDCYSRIDCWMPAAP